MAEKSEPEYVLYQALDGGSRRVNIANWDRTTRIFGGEGNWGTGVTLTEVAISPKGRVLIETDNRWQGSGYGVHWSEADPESIPDIYEKVTGTDVGDRLWDLIPVDEEEEEEDSTLIRCDECGATGDQQSIQEHVESGVCRR